MSRFYDRQGKPLTLLEWAKMLEVDAVKIVAQTTLPNGRWISTVWLGLDHQYGDDESSPLIFETMVFPSEDDLLALDCWRYSSEAEARAGHVRMVDQWRLK